MITGVTRCVHAFDLPVCTLYSFTWAQPLIGNKFLVYTFFYRGVAIVFNPTVRAIPAGRCASRLLQRLGGRGVITMTVGNQDVADMLAA